jgi:hypothetical protein
MIYVAEPFERYLIQLFRAPNTASFINTTPPYPVIPSKAEGSYVSTSCIRFFNRLRMTHYRETFITTFQSRSFVGPEIQPPLLLFEITPDTRRSCAHFEVFGTGSLTCF